MIHTILMQSTTMSMTATTASTAMAVAIGFKDQAKVTTLNSFPLFRSLVIEFRCYLILLTNHLKRNHLLKRKIAKSQFFARKFHRKMIWVNLNSQVDNMLLANSNSMLPRTHFHNSFSLPTRLLPTAWWSQTFYTKSGSCLSSIFHT